MPKYLVQIDASNFLINLDGKITKHGFINFQFVEAKDPAAAEISAVQMLREDQELREIVLNEPGDPPVMDVISINEVDFEELPTGRGKIWYEMSPKRWWQFWR